MKKNRIKKILIGLLCICILGGGYVGYRYYAYYYRYENEVETTLTETNTDPVLSEKQLEKNLKKYKTLNELGMSDINKSNSYVIPGLKATKTLAGDKSEEFDMCTSMTPQGITVTEKYLFISAYCHTHKHNSVLYMIDKDTHEYIKEIILPGRPHAGNIAYDDVNGNIWIACTGTNFLTDGKTAYLNYLSLDNIESYDFNETVKPIKYNGKYQIDGFKNASFISYYKNNIFVGNYYEGEWLDSYVARFPIADDGGLETKTVLTLSGEKEIAYGKEKAVIDEYCQGVYLDSGYTLIMQSSGTKKSLIQSFVCSDYQQDVEEMIQLEKDYKTYMKQQEQLQILDTSLKNEQNILNDLNTQKENLDEKDDEYDQKVKDLNEQIEECNSKVDEVQKAYDEYLNTCIDFDEQAYLDRCKEEREYYLKNVKADRTFEFPARLEQAMISPYGNYKVYLLFESGAYSYRMQLSVDVVDRVIVMG